MQFTRNSHLKNIKKVTKLVPSPFIIIFSALLILSLFSIFRDLATSGLKPFGFLNNIYAAVTGQSTLGSKMAAAAVSNDYKIIDGWGRCLVIKPNAKVQVQTLADSGFNSGTLDVTSKGGINQGMAFDNVGTQLDFLRSADINMSYVEALTTDPGSGSAAAGFVKEVNEAGKFPVIRLCYIGGCNFKNGAADIVSFYNDVEKYLAGTDYVYVGVLGPNEPNTGTPTEMSGFGLADNDYAAAVNMSNSAAQQLQNARAENGGHAYFAPAIFNMPNGVDIPEYLLSTAHATIDPSLFDFLMGNTYNIDAGLAPDWYSRYGMKKYVEDHPELLTLISEFGYSDNRGIGALKASYNTLCNDDTVDGIMFFRPDYPELDVGAPRQEPPIDSQVLKQIVDGCTKEPQKLKSRNSSWLNCNFDSCVSKDYKYSARSVAHPLTPVIVSSTTGGGGSGGGGSGGGTGGTCNPNAYSVYSSKNVLNIGKSDKDQTKVILIGDSETYNDPYPNAINIGQPGASTYWFLGNDVTDANNPAKVKAKTDFENSLKSNAFAAVIMLGTNDCGGVDIAKFKENLTAIVQKYITAGIIPILSTFPERDTSKIQPPTPTCAGTTDSFNSAIRGIAATYNNGLVNGGLVLRDGNQMVTLGDLKDDGLHISNYSCLDSGTTNVLNKVRTILGGAPIDVTPGTPPVDTSPVPDQNQDLKAWLKINCSGDSCDSKQINTIQTWLPIKSLGSTTSTNSAKYRSYTPSCVELASQVNSDQYDLLNQFAGKLTSGGTVYPMPWLGSMINCIAEMADYSKDFAGQPLVQSDFNPHPFSKVTAAKAETTSDIARGLAQSPVNIEAVNQIYSELQNKTVYIPDERSVCIKDNKTGTQTCYDNSSIDLLKLYRAYDAQSVPKSWYSINYTTSTGQIAEMEYLKNSDDLIPGPEVVTNTSNSTFSASELCRKYGIRKIDDETKNNYRFTGDINCTVNQSDSAIFDRISVVPGFPQFDIITYCRNVISDADLAQFTAFAAGTSNQLKDTRYSGCFVYNPKPTDLIEFKTTDYSPAPQYNIEGAYDALYKQYLRLETEMSARNEKVVFQKDLGWVGSSDSIIRDGNRPVDVGDYLFKGEYDSAVCENVNFFDNKSSKARGSAVKKTPLYYSELGALDPMQEWIDVYTNGTNLPGEVSIDNPFYDPGDPSKPNFDQKQILVSGALPALLSGQDTSDILPANFAMNFQLPTCDQANIGNSYSNSDLYTALRAMDKYKALTDVQVHDLAHQIWPFDSATPSTSVPACISYRNDARFSDTMSEFLCKQGYAIDGVCNASSVPVIGNGDNFKCVYNGQPVSSNDATCPGIMNGSAGKCLEGPKVGTHQASGLNAVDIAADTLIAPFDGQVVKAYTAYPNYCLHGGTAGGAVFYKGTFLGKEVVMFFMHVFATPGLEGMTFKKGDVIARTNQLNDPTVTNSACIGSYRHLHIEISNDQFKVGQGLHNTDDILGMLYAMGCKQSASAGCQIGSGVIQCDLPPGACDGLGGVTGGCNEWNCDSKTNFEDSLSCISGLSYLKNPTDQFIDIYGPYCDNETYKSGTLPFAYNFTTFYDKYLPPGTVGGRTCGDLPPSSARPGDTGMACPGFAQRYGSEAYNYYRGALIKCPIPDSQKGWTAANTFGHDDPNDLADYLMNTLNVTYNGHPLKNTPKVKVAEVLGQARAHNINPFMLLGTWATESWFGQFNPKCNIATDPTNISCSVVPIAQTKIFCPVGKSNPLGEAYSPSGLVNITGVTTASGNQVLSNVLPDLQDMYNAAKADGVNFTVVSAFRSYTDQKAAFAAQVVIEKKKDPTISDEEAQRRANLSSAKPGESEHQLGTAMDISSPTCADAFNDFTVCQANVDVWTWLGNNAYKYGFALSYPPGQEAKTGYVSEPWHYRWIGKDKAAAFKTAGGVLIDYLKTTCTQ